MNRAFTLVELIICILILGILAVLIIPGLGRGRYSHERSKVSRVKTDMRSTATAIESYYFDHEQWPAMISMNRPGADSRWLTQSGGHRMHSISEGLTTPVAYITSLHTDMFALQGKSFAYHHDENGWILISPGPDEDYDLKSPEKVYDSSVSQPSPLLVSGPWTYDPTNGTMSNGDVWRVKD